MPIWPLRCPGAALFGAAGLVASCAAAAQSPPAIEWGLTAGVRHRSLSEWSSGTGAKLLTERGALARVQAQAQLTSAALPVLAFEAALTDGRLDYRGQTQSGVPLATTSHHSEGELSLRWRPLPAAPWGEAWLGLTWLRARRAIASSPIAGGLTETSTLVLPSLRWSSPAFALPGLAGAPLRAEAEWRSSVHHRLRVDYLGVFDESTLTGARRSQAILRLVASPSQQWRWTVEWSRSRQAASEPAALYRAGMPAGTVRQPRLQMGDLSLAVTRAF